MEGNRGDVSVYAKLIKGDSKCIYNVANDFCFFTIKESRKKKKYPVFHRNIEQQY